MSHPLLSLCTSTLSPSSTLPTFPMIPQAHTIPSGHHEHLPCDDPRQSDSSTQTSIPAGHEPKIIETEAGSNASEPKDLEPKGIELDRNLGIDPYQIQEIFMGENNQNPITEDVE